jgi:small subunit ribosomal protein S20
VPNTKSAIKMVRVAERRRARNRPIRSALKTYVKKARVAIEGTPDDAADAVKAAIRALDKAVNKGIIHRNNAARRKSRLMKHLNGAATRATTPTATATRTPTRRTATKKR